MFWFRSARTTRRNSSSRRRGLHIEPLEQRRMLTLATVTATGGGNYLVQDDTAGHDIKIKWEQMGDVNFDGIVNSVDQGLVSSGLGTTRPRGGRQFRRLRQHFRPRGGLVFVGAGVADPIL